MAPERESEKSREGRPPESEVGEPERTLSPSEAGFEQPSSAEPVRELLGRLGNKSGDTPRYSKLDEFARGGMGAIHRAWDEELDREVAMKIALSADARSGSHTTSLGRFLDEAQLTGQLVHPGIVPVHELGLDEEGAPYFTMQLVKGRELREIFEDKRKGDGEWTLTRILGVVLKVCEAMAYAHDKGIIHRDLKPANVMVGRFGEVYVMDWGLARVLGREDKQRDRLLLEAQASVEVRGVRDHAQRDDPDSPLLTRFGDVIGTPAYMPPEQAQGDVERMDRRADVYAVGAMLYELLTDRLPYEPDEGSITPHAVVAMLLHGPPCPLAELAPGAPSELVAICEKAMAREPDGRYSDMAALASDLSAYLDGRVVSAYEAGAWAEARKWLRRNRLVASLLGLVVVTTASGLGGVAVVEAKARRAAEEQHREVLGFAAQLEVLSDEAKALAQAKGIEAREAEAARGRAEELYEELQGVVDALAQPFPVATRFVRVLEGKDVTLMPGERLAFDDRIVLEVHCLQTLNLYVFNQDDTGMVKQIFPVEGLPPYNPLEDEVLYRLPKYGSWTVTREQGTERFLLLALPKETEFDPVEWGLDEYIRVDDPFGTNEPVRSVDLAPELDAELPPALGIHPLDLFERLRTTAQHYGGAWVRTLEYEGGGGSDE